MLILSSSHLVFSGIISVGHLHAHQLAGHGCQAEADPRYLQLQSRPWLPHFMCKGITCVYLIVRGGEHMHVIVHRRAIYTENIYSCNLAPGSCILCAKAQPSHMCTRMHMCTWLLTCMHKCTLERYLQLQSRPWLPHFMCKGITCVFLYENIHKIVHRRKCIEYNYTHMNTLRIFTAAISPLAPASHMCTCVNI